MGVILGLLILCLPYNAQAKEHRLLVLGDSISAAYGMSLEQGWVALLAQNLADREPAPEVINASISGETTGGGLRRLPALLAQHSPSLVILELGGNDGLRGFPLSALRSNLDQLVDLSQAAGAEVILVPMEIPPNYGARYTAGFRASFVDTNPALMQADGIHPSVEAQPLLLQNILPTVQAVLAE